jgi:hypothetical protein
MRVAGTWREHEREGGDHEPAHRLDYQRAERRIVRSIEADIVVPLIAAIVSSMKLKGTITRTDLEGGAWLLKADDGNQYQLTGSVDGAKDGMRVEVEGKVDKNAMGIGMMGAHFAVQKLTAL